MGKQERLESHVPGAAAKPPGIGSDPAVGLSEVDRRRAHLWGVSIFVLVAVTVVVALLTLGRNPFPGSLRLTDLWTWVAVVLTVGLGLAFLLYVMQRERELRRLSVMLVQERERSAQLDARLGEQERIVAGLRDVDRLKSDFVAMVSHELKTPLTGIIGASRTVAQHGPRMSSEQQKRFIDMIERQSTRLLGLVEDALVTSRIDSGAMGLRRERVDLCDLVHAVVEDLSHTDVGRDRKVVVLNGTGGPEVWGDPTALQQVVANLVENGLKYSEIHTDVTVRLEDAPAEVLVEVSDEGEGISSDEMQTIFDRFRQVDTARVRSVGGFGLGLYIVKNLVEQHGGQIDVSSEPGDGTRFTVHLPKRSEDQR
jgi:signal transduction histidine kinase